MVQVDWIEGGETRMLAPADARPMGRPVMLPPARDAVATAAWIQAALSGEQPVPENVARQVALILGAIAGGKPPAGVPGGRSPTTLERPSARPM